MVRLIQTHFLISSTTATTQMVMRGIFAILTVTLDISLRSTRESRRVMIEIRSHSDAGIMLHRILYK